MEKTISNIKIVKQLWLFCTSLFVVIAFQNCDTSQPMADQDSVVDIKRQIIIASPDASWPSPDEAVVFKSDDYRKVRINSGELFFDGLTHSKVQPYMEVDLDTYTVKFHVVDGASVTCVLDADHHARLTGLLSGVSVCGPPPPKEGQVNCLAMSVPDIFLTNGEGASVSLAEPICGTGQWMCEHGNSQLRAALAEIVASDEAAICVSEL